METVPENVVNKTLYKKVKEEAKLNIVSENDGIATANIATVVEDKEEDILRHAQEWIKNNQEKYNNWLEIAKKAAN